MLLFIAILFIGGGWLIGKLVSEAAFPKSEYPDYSQPSKTVVNNYIQETHNHLHVSEKEFEKLKSR